MFLSYFSGLSLDTTRKMAKSVNRSATVRAPDFNFWKNKNLAIANRSRVSCAHNTLRASISINITP